MRVIKGTYFKNYKGVLQSSVGCNECGENVSHVLEIGETPDYDSQTARLCYACIAKAYNVAMVQMPKKILPIKANIELMRGSENDEGID